MTMDELRAEALQRKRKPPEEQATSPAPKRPVAIDSPDRLLSQQASQLAINCPVTARSPLDELDAPFALRFALAAEAAAGTAQPERYAAERDAYVGASDEAAAAAAVNALRRRERRAPLSFGERPRPGRVRMHSAVADVSNPGAPLVPQVLEYGATLAHRVFGDRLLRVRFTQASRDDGDSHSRSSEQRGRDALMRHGFELCGRSYRYFVAKEEQVWFIAVASANAHDRAAAWEGVEASAARLADFGSVATVAKFDARLALAFSQTHRALDTHRFVAKGRALWNDMSPAPEGEVHVYEADDIDGGLDPCGDRRCLTDGCGLIALDLARRVPFCTNGHAKRANDGGGEIEPTLAMQVRLWYQGSLAKGMLVTSAQLPAGVIVLRPSMIKVVGRAATDFSALEVIRTSDTSGVAKSGKVLVSLLEHGGVPRETLLQLQKRAADELKATFAPVLADAVKPDDVDRALAPAPPVAVVLRAIDRRPPAQRVDDGRGDLRLSLVATVAGAAAPRHDVGRGNDGYLKPGFREFDERVSRKAALIELRGPKLEIVAASPTRATNQDVVIEVQRAAGGPEELLRPFDRVRAVRRGHHPHGREREAEAQAGVRPEVRLEQVRVRRRPRVLGGGRRRRHRCGRRGLHAKGAAAAHRDARRVHKPAPGLRLDGQAVAARLLRARAALSAEARQGSEGPRKRAR